MKNKVTSLDRIIENIKDGDVIAFGGNVLHRSPIHMARKIALSKAKDLQIVKTAMAMEADILCGMGKVKTVSAGFVGYETEYGLCSFYRKAVQGGETWADEHACYSVIAALRAAAYGVPFLPIRGFNGSDLLEAVCRKTVIDPYSGEELVAIKAIQPDYAFIHVQKADQYGNSQIIGPVYEDLTIVRATKKVIITCEEIVPDDYFGKDKIADISGVLVEHVMLDKGGAWPGTCAEFYDLDHKEIGKFKELVTRQELQAYLEGIEENYEKVQ